MYQSEAVETQTSIRLYKQLSLAKVTVLGARGKTYSLVGGNIPKQTGVAE
jgi:hypothetical protein